MLRQLLLAAVCLAATLPAASAPAQDGDPALAEAAAVLTTYYGKRFGGTAVTATTREQPVCGEALVIDAAPIRGDGNHPMVLHHGRRTADAVVLVHGLSDSPYFMCAIARRFHAAGANVVLPLLTGHGLKEPRDEIHLPDLDQRWIEDVATAVTAAQALGGRVSIGGLSTGGALAVLTAAREPARINGGVFLFSAALAFDEKGMILGHCADLTFGLNLCYRAEAAILRRAEAHRELAGRNPYRSWFSYYGVLHLARVRNAAFAAVRSEGLRQPLFAAHSEADETAYPKGVRDLASLLKPGTPPRLHWLAQTSPESCPRFRSSECRMGEELVSTGEPCGIAHASVVLETPLRIEDGAAVCEPANPAFAGMMADALDFLEREVRGR